MTPRQLENALLDPIIAEMQQLGAPTDEQGRVGGIQAVGFVSERLNIPASDAELMLRRAQAGKAQDLIELTSGFGVLQKQAEMEPGIISNILNAPGAA